MKSIKNIILTIAVICLWCMPGVANANQCVGGAWSEIAGTGLTTIGWPSGGVGTWSLALGTNHFPATVGTDTSGITTWWITGNDQMMHYQQNTFDTNSWVEECVSGHGCAEGISPSYHGPIEFLSFGEDPAWVNGWAGNGGFEYPYYIWTVPLIGWTYDGIFYEPADQQVAGTGHFANLNFTLDASANLYVIGTAVNCSASGVPHGPCIEETTNHGSTWTALTDSPGASQITSDLLSSPQRLLAVDNSHGVWYRSFGFVPTWTGPLSNSICSGSGGGTITVDQIAANDGIIWAINDASGSPGVVYQWDIGSSTCWSLSSVQTGTLTALSISASITQSYINGSVAENVIATDGSGNIWAFITGLCD